MQGVPSSIRIGLVAALCGLPSMTLSAQQTIQGLPPGAAAWYLATDDRAGEIFVYEIGAGGGAPVVVLHGGPGGELTYMLPVARGLDSAFRFVFYDQRGSLRSAVALDSVSMAKHVADLETLRRALGVERIRLLSHSAGTLLAFEYLRTHPSRVAEIALVGALPHKNGAAHFDAEYAEFWRPLAADLERFGSRPAVQRELARVEADTALTPERRAAAAGLIRQLSADLVHIERWASHIPIRVRYGAAVRTRESTNFEYDYGPDLAAHPFRVTVINGEYDYVVGPSGSPLWKRLVETAAPNLRVVVIPEAGHLTWGDQPDGVRTALRAALGGGPRE